MKNILLILSFLSIHLLVFGQEKKGIEFFDGTWEEALALAKKDHKIIFVDAYASWCGPCKRMAKNVFTDEEVGKVYNRHFINVKMDMEKGKGPEFAQKYGVSSYPTLFFIDEEAQVVNQVKGARNIEQFIALAKATLNSYSKSTDYAEEYEEGNRDPEFLRAYAYALLMSSEPTLKIANEYLRTQEQLDSEENLDFIFDFATEADSRIFTMMLQYKDLIIQRQSEKTFLKQVEKACDQTIKKAVDYKSESLLEEAKKQMKIANPKYAKEYALLADISYYFLLENYDLVISTTDKYLKKYAKGDAVKAYNHAEFLTNFVKGPKALTIAEVWAKKAYEIDSNLKHGELYLKVLRKNSKHKEADALAPEIEKLKLKSTEKKQRLSTPHSPD